MCGDWLARRIPHFRHTERKPRPELTATVSNGLMDPREQLYKAAVCSNVEMKG
jgi:hypothetical protein